MIYHDIYVWFLDHQLLLNPKKIKITKYKTK